MPQLQRVILFLSLLVLIFPIVWSQTLSPQKVLGRYQQLVWQDQHGLPQNGVLAILRTRDGYLWLGTIEGAARFDGVRFVVFDNNNTPEFKTNQILSLAEDRAGSLWLGAVSGGLTRYTEGRFHLYTTKEGLTSDSIRCLLADQSGKLWIGTRGGGLNLFHEEKFSAFTTRDGLPSDQILSLAEERNGDLWIGTSNGLARLSAGRITAFTTRDGLPNERVNALQFDKSGTLWVGTGGGLCRLEQGRFIADGPLAHTSSTALLEDRQKNIWIGTHGEGLYLLKNGQYKQYNLEDGLSSDTVLALYQDPEGDIWVGTVDGGLCQLREGRFSVFTMEDGLPHNFVTAVFEDSQGSLWMGTNGGVGRMKDGVIKSFPAPGGRPENDSITQDRDGNIWFSVGGQLTQYRNGQFFRWSTSQGLPYEPVRELLGDRAGNLWVSTPGNGLSVLQNGRFRNFGINEGLADNEITAAYEGRSGTLWFGTRNGAVSRFEPKSQRFISWTINEGLPGDQVMTFHEDRMGALWIGTNGGGLIRFKDGKFARCTVRDGLYDNRMFQILSDTDDDSGDLWISSNRGIFRNSLKELNDFADGRTKSVTSFVYGVFDGMLSRECNGASPGGWKTRDGRLWFPTVKGVVALDPKQRNTQPTGVAIERIILDRTPLPPDSSIEIKPDQENLEIEYTGINWRRPQQIRFKYQLTGFNQDWVETGTRRTAYFSKLPPGEYTFKVIADNGEGVWTNEAKTLRIVVLPPFYRTIWFVLLMTLFFGSLIFGAFKYRVNQLQQRQLVQQEFTRQLIESQESERKRIAAELHDGLGQNLLVIKNRALFGLMKLTDVTSTTEQLTDISNTASQAIDEVRQIAANLHPYQLDRLGLTKALNAMVRKVGAAAQLEVLCQIENIDGLLPPTAEINLYRIVQECMNNIFKHAQATEARVQLRRQSDNLQLTIQDNGKGFIVTDRGARKVDGEDYFKAKRQNSNGGGFGLTGLSERTAMLRGNLQIDSTAGEGTRISLSVPINQQKETT